METRITGKVIVLGDNVDTDQIYPGACSDRSAGNGCKSCAG